MKQSEAIRSVIGIDLGDRYSHLHELDMQTGETLSQTRLPTSPEMFGKHFGSISKARVTLEVGAHSPWSSRLLQDLGHQVIVANSRTLALIHLVLEARLRSWGQRSCFRQRGLHGVPPLIVG